MADESEPRPPFVSGNWLAEHLGDPDIQIIDGSWYLPTQDRSGRQEHLDAHVPGAIFFDIDEVADQSSDLPHMLLDGEAFGRAVGALGISSEKTLVVYDGSGLFSAPRVWWMLRHYGAQAVRILDGGLPRWRAEGRPVEAGSKQAEPARFVVNERDGEVADLTKVQEALSGNRVQVVDARPAVRFLGESPEPRAGVRSGHMPGSKNLPYTELIVEGQLRSPESLKAAFAAIGLDTTKPVITSCGSGVSAAILLLALETMGEQNVSLYDGSWAEYGGRRDLPVQITEVSAFERKL